MGKKGASRQVVRYEALGVSTLSALEEAKDFLRQVLAPGRLLPAVNVRRLADEAGIAPRTLERARQLLPIKTVRRGVPGRRGGGDWAWYLDNPGDSNATKDIVSVPMQSGAQTPELAFAIRRASREFIRETQRVNSVGQRLAPFIGVDNPSPAAYRTILEGDPLSGPYVRSLWAQLESFLDNRGPEVANGKHSANLALPAILPEHPSSSQLRVIQLNGVVVSKLRKDGHVLGCFVMSTLEQIPINARGVWKYRKLEHKRWLEIRTDPLPQRRVQKALAYLREGGSLPFTTKAMAAAFTVDETTPDGVAVDRESKWFEEARLWLRSCRFGNHLYLADRYSQRDCYAHRNAIRQKRFRLTSTDGIGVDAPLAAGSRLLKGRGR